MIEWIVILGLVIAMYIVIYKYEQKMDKLHKKIEEHANKLDEHHSRISKNREHINENYEKLDTHDNHIEEMWVTIPKVKKESK